MGCRLLVKFGNAFAYFVVLCSLARWRYYQLNFYLEGAHGADRVCIVYKYTLALSLTLNPNPNLTLNPKPNLTLNPNRKH